MPRVAVTGAWRSSANSVSRRSAWASVSRPAPPARDHSLDAAAALIELAGRQGHDVKGIHDRPGLWELLAGGALEPGEAVHGYHLDPPTPVLVALGEPGLEDLLDTGPRPRPADGPVPFGRARGSGR